MPPLGELKVYEVSEAELEKLESGPPGQVHLSFALALLPAIQTVEIKENRIYFGYWIAFWLLSVQGLISLMHWWTTGGSLKSLVMEIRSRMPDKPGIAEQATTSVQEPETEPKGA